jgi:hypothetical protein
MCVTQDWHIVHLLLYMHLVNMISFLCLNKLFLFVQIIIRLKLITCLFLSTTKVVAPLHIVHTDLWGPSPLLSQDGNKYYVLLLMSIPDIVEFIFVHANMRYLKFLPNLSSELKPYWITK